MAVEPVTADKARRQSSPTTVEIRTGDHPIDIEDWVRRYVTAFFALDAEEQQSGCSERDEKAREVMGSTSMDELK